MLTTNFSPNGAMTPPRRVPPQQSGGQFLHDKEQNVQHPQRPPEESLKERTSWFTHLIQAFEGSPQKESMLMTLLNKGVLSDTSGDDKHSTLYYLHKRLIEPTAPGLDAQKTVGETLDLLSDSTHINQSLSPLSSVSKQLMMSTYVDPVVNAHNQQPSPAPTTTKGLDLNELNSCTVSAEIGRLADEHPKEVARLIYEASGPQQMAHEQVLDKELFPDAPVLARQVLSDLNLDLSPRHLGRGLGRGVALPKNDEAQAYTVELPVPYLGLIRAMNAQDADTQNGPHASGVEILLQSMLLYNFSSKSYDAGRDKRDALDHSTDAINHAECLSSDQKAQLNAIINASPRRPDVAKARVFNALDNIKSVNEADKEAIRESFLQKSSGLTQEEQLMMERIMEDGEQLENVTYQQLGSQDKDEHVIYGYTKPFSRIRHDLNTALNEKNEQVLVNLITPKKDGTFSNGHVVRVLSTRESPLNHHTEFLVHDTSIPHAGASWMHESELIPRVHHITIPQDEADLAWKENTRFMNADPDGLLSSNEANDVHYQLTFKTQPMNANNRGESPLEYHKRIHAYRTAQADQVLESLKHRHQGSSQNKTESAPVQWHGSHPS